MNKAVMCTVEHQAQAESIVRRLQGSRFSSNDISVLFPNTQGTQEFAYQHNTKAPEGAVAGFSAGGVLGGTLGLLAGIGALVIPGLGPFIAAGPLLAALGGASVGATLGGVTGALVGMGIPEIEARQYEGRLKGGHILISVHTSTSEGQKKAEEILRAGGAADVFSTTEAPVPKNQEIPQHA